MNSSDFGVAERELGLLERFSNASSTASSLLSSVALKEN
jgi:hypothetical protein